MARSAPLVKFLRSWTARVIGGPPGILERTSARPAIAHPVGAPRPAPSPAGQNLPRPDPRRPGPAPHREPSREPSPPR